MSYAYAVYKTADSSTTLQMSNRDIVEHPEQMVKNFGEHILRIAVKNILSLLAGLLQAFLF